MGSFLSDHYPPFIGRSQLFCFCILLNKYLTHSAWYPVYVSLQVLLYLKGLKWSRAEEKWLLSNPPPPLQAERFWAGTESVTPQFPVCGNGGSTLFPDDCGDERVSQSWLSLFCSLSTLIQKLSRFRFLCLASNLQFSLVDAEPEISVVKFHLCNCHLPASKPLGFPHCLTFA